MIFWAEVSRQIGMGHLMECLTLAREARNRGADVRFVITPFEPAQTLLYENGIEHATAPLAEGLAALDLCAQGPAPGLAVIDHRSVQLTHLAELRKRGWRLAVIDQLGNKPVICDLLFNSSILEDWRVYDFPGGPVAQRFGPSFALLRSEFASLNQREKKFSGPPHKILVTMGGVDRTGATFKVMEALTPLGGRVEKEIITGAGFLHGERLARAKTQADDSFTFAENVADLGESLSAADLAISAGGNTLVECACAGTPAMVLGEDDHENRLGMEFARLGAALHLGAGANTGVERISEMVSGLVDDEAARKRMSQRGRKLVDGLGNRRACDELMQLEAA